MLTLKFGDCHICGKFGVLSGRKVLKCGSCECHGYTKKRNPFIEKKKCEKQKI